MSKIGGSGGDDSMGRDPTFHIVTKPVRSCLLLLEEEEGGGAGGKCFCGFRHTIPEEFQPDEASLHKFLQLYPEVFGLYLSCPALAAAVVSYSSSYSSSPSSATNTNHKCSLFLTITGTGCLLCSLQQRHRAMCALSAPHPAPCLRFLLHLTSLLRPSGRSLPHQGQGTGTTSRGQHLQGDSRVRVPRRDLADAGGEEEAEVAVGVCELSMTGVKGYMTP
eukprot:72551-Hanusia_phi.AAC.1